MVNINIEDVFNIVFGFYFIVIDVDCIVLDKCILFVIYLDNWFFLVFNEVFDFEIIFKVCESNVCFKLFF